MVEKRNKRMQTVPTKNERLIQRYVTRTVEVLFDVEVVCVSTVVRRERPLTNTIIVLFCFDELSDEVSL